MELKTLKDEEIELKLCLFEFNWRWKAFLKQEYTPQQFSTGFRRFIKKRITNITKEELEEAGG